MQLPYFLLAIYIQAQSSLALPPNSPLLYLPSSNTTFSAWPPTPYATTSSPVQITINEYGRVAAPSLQQEILHDIDALVGEVRRDPRRYTQAPVEFFGAIVTINFNLSDPRRLNSRIAALAIVLLRGQMERFRAREIERAVLRFEFMPPGTWIPLAEVTVRFSRVDDGQ